MIPAFFVLVFIFGAIGLKAQASDPSNIKGSYWKNYFSSVEEKAVKKNAQQYVLSQIQKKSADWKGIFTSFNIKKGAINNDAVKDGGLGTDKIQGLDTALQEKLSASGGTLTGIFNWAENQTFPADKLTGEYPALDGSKITNITASQINAVPYSGATGPVDLNGKDLVNVGNVGIGTTSPGYTLQVNGTSYANNMALPNTSDAGTIGVIRMGDFGFIHNYANSGSVGQNTFVGVYSGNFTMSPAGGDSNLASYNTGLGRSSLTANTTGYNNTATGHNSLHANTTGYSNTATGVHSLLGNTIGVENNSFGGGAMASNISGNGNTAVGTHALMANTIASFNTAIGQYAGYGDRTNTDNQSITDSNSIFIGALASRDGSVANTTSLTNAIAIGYSATVASSNSLILGGVGSHAVNVGIGTIKPFNAKLDIQNGDIALSLNKGLYVGDGRTFTRRLIGQDTSNTIRIGQNSSQFNAISFSINGGTDLVNITSGNVGIGTTTPAAALDVNGQVKIQKSSSQPFACDAAHDGTIALTSTYRTCACKGGSTTWVYTSDGTTACVWQ